MKIYFDACSYNRPFDDLTQMRVRMEAEAILAIISICRSRGWILVGSDVVDLEIAEIRNVSKKQKVVEFCELAQEKVYANDATAKRADELQALGFGALDSFHVALAEYADADVLLSTDDKLIKLANRLGLGLRVDNPLKWLSEVL